MIFLLIFIELFVN